MANMIFSVSWLFSVLHMDQQPINIDSAINEARDCAYRFCLSLYVKSCRIKVEKNNRYGTGFAYYTAEGFGILPAREPAGEAIVHVLGSGAGSKMWQKV